MGGSIAQSLVSFLVPQSLDAFTQSRCPQPKVADLEKTQARGPGSGVGWGLTPLPEELGHKVTFSPHPLVRFAAALLTQPFGGLGGSGFLSSPLGLGAHAPPHVPTCRVPSLSQTSIVPLSGLCHLTLL